MSTSALSDCFLVLDYAKKKKSKVVKSLLNTWSSRLIALVLCLINMYTSPVVVLSVQKHYFRSGDSLLSHFPKVFLTVKVMESAARISSNLYCSLLVFFFDYLFKAARIKSIFSITCDLSINHGVNYTKFKKNIINEEFQLSSYVVKLS